MAEGTSNIDVPKVVKFLHRSFEVAQERARPVIGRDNARKSRLYGFQVDFCYLIDEIMRGPTYIIPKRIQATNNLITRLENVR